MNQAKTFFLMVVLTIIFVALGSLIGGQNGGMIAFFIALVMNSTQLFLLSHKRHRFPCRRFT
jgi:heat shock protein HtpX